jgi:hypothetical protein
MKGWHFGAIPSLALASSTKQCCANEDDSAMNSLVLLIALSTFLFTLLVGCVILRFRNKLTNIFSFASGGLPASDSNSRDAA